MLSFITNGNFIDFKDIEVPSYGKPELYTHPILKLHKTSRAVNWTYSDDPTTISFTVDERKYTNIPISTIFFDGVAMSVQADFETKIKLMFPGLAGLSYLVYTALLSQTGINAPTATILQNTLGATPVWTRITDGAFKMTLTGQLVEAKTFYNIQNNADPSQGWQIGIPTNLTGFPDFIQIVTNDSTGSSANGVLFNTPFEIRIYN